MTRRRRTLTVCAETGCPELSEQTYCTEHQHDREHEWRARVERQRYGQGWAGIRAHQLHQHPTCQCTDPACRCGGSCDAAANEVDHIAPAALFTSLHAAHYHTNLQSLCKPCHSSKTARDDSSFARHAH